MNATHGVRQHSMSCLVGVHWFLNSLGEVYSGSYYSTELTFCQCYDELRYLAMEKSLCDAGGKAST